MLNRDPLLGRFLKLCILVATVLVFGTVGYVVLEGWRFSDGFFMTVITMSTVGYGETNNLTGDGRWFTSLLILVCVFSMTCWSAALTSFIIGNDLSGHFLRRRVLKMVERLANHTIVCGGGLMGQSVIRSLLSKKEPVVVIENDDDVVERLRRMYPKLLVIQGSATDELTLADANVLEASHVVAVMHCEIDNLLVAITCKDMGHDIKVFARSDDLTIANRLRKASVDEVISPSQIAGLQIADAILT